MPQNSQQGVSRDPDPPVSADASANSLSTENTRGSPTPDDSAVTVIQADQSVLPSEPSIVPPLEISVELTSDSADAAVREMHAVILRFFSWRGYDLDVRTTASVSVVLPRSAEEGDAINLHPDASDVVDEEGPEVDAEFDVIESVGKFENHPRYR